MEDASIIKMIFNRHVLEYLLLDYEDTGRKLFSNSAIINAAKSFENWSQLFNSFKDIMHGLQKQR